VDKEPSYCTAESVEMTKLLNPEGINHVVMQSGFAQGELSPYQLWMLMMRETGRAE